jgi:hypothetical protein
MQPRALCHSVGTGVLALAGTIAPVAAHSAPGARPIVVLESYVGQRPDDAGAILEPLLDELDSRGFAARPASVLHRLGRRAPRPGVLDRNRTVAEITQPVETGYAAYTRGRFAEAQATLRIALDQIHRNPALLVLDTNNLNAIFKTLVALALSQAKRGDTGGSVATMIELIRTFRSQPITRADYGPDAEQFYRAVWKQVQAMGRGQLSIAVDSEQAVIFVDGQIRGLGRAALVDLIPGIYRVFVQVPGTVGRQYEREVTANELAELDIDWELDSSLWMSDQWTGLMFSTEAERAKQGGFAGKLARRWGQLIAVIGLEPRRGGARVTASLYDPTGHAVRSAAVELDGGDPRKLRSLARYLADGALSDEVAVIRDPEGRAVAANAAGPPGPPGPSARLAPSLLVGAGFAALVTGGVLYAIDQDPVPSAPSLVRNTAPAGVAVGAVGLAAMGMGMGLWLWGTRGGRSAPFVALGCCGGFIGWAGELW